MTNRMTWPDLCKSERYKGLWVAIDNCRYDASTRQPVEGDVVDSDQELSELCGRMREAGRSSCTICNLRVRHRIPALTRDRKGALRFRTRDAR